MTALTGKTHCRNLPVVETLGGMRVWFVDDVEAYAAEVEDFLARDPVGCTVPLTVIQGVRAGVSYEDAPVWSWVTDHGGDVVGTASWTPPHLLLLSPMPESAAAAVGRAWKQRPVGGAVGPRPAVDQCGEQLAGAGSWFCSRAERLFRLNMVTVPPRPAGSPRLAGAGDVDLAAAWVAAFAREAGAIDHDPRGKVERGVAAGRLWLWDKDGPASLVMVSGPVAGVARLGPVYTPPERRTRGYARALVAHVSQARLDVGDTACCLFTDLANPVSNSIYAQIGYHPVGDYAELRHGES